MTDVSHRHRTPDGRFADESRHSRVDDLDDAPPPLVTVKGLSRLLYEMGRTFDNLSSTRLATEQFLSTGNPKVLGSRNDLDLLLDLKAAASFVIDRDYDTSPFDLSYVRGINACMTRTAAIEPGVLRTSCNIGVPTSYGRYIPPVPDETELSRYIDLAANDTHVLSAASVLFARLAKAQPFGDGNKRCALLAANGLLLRADYRGMLSVPVDGDDKSTFNDLLSKWYMSDDNAIFAWLEEWNVRNG